MDITTARLLNLFTLVYHLDEQVIEFLAVFGYDFLTLAPNDFDNIDKEIMVIEFFSFLYIWMYKDTRL